MRFLKLWLQIALEWLHECCMGYVSGRKPEHKTLCFSVWSGCSRWWKVPCVCGGCGCSRLVPSMCFATMVVPVCVVLCVSWSCGCNCGSHWNGCMNVACCVLWGGSRSTKPCVFLCKVAAAGDERYLVCARRLRLRLVPSMCFATMVVPACVVLCVSWSCGCGSHWNGCMNVACCVLWGGSRSTKPCVFRCKVAAAGDERYLVCAAVAAAVVWFLLCVLQQWLFLCA